MNRKRFVSDLLFPVPVIAGMLVCHLFSTLWVWTANARLYDKVGLLAASGYLAVPNAATAPLLKTFKAAFCGGLFFTFTLGAGLSVLAFILSQAIFRRVTTISKKASLIILGLIFLLIIVFINLNGFALFPTLIAIFTPPAVIFSSAFFARRSQEPPSLKQAACFVVPLIILGLAWGLHKDDKLFDHLRDDVLLTSGPGIAFVDFYYRYTLYPTEPIKPLVARLIKSARISGAADPQLTAEIKIALVNMDYLPVNHDGPVDLSLKIDGGSATLWHGGKKVDEMPVGEFLQNTAKHLAEFSKKLDNMAASRAVMGFGLLLGFPLVLYIIGFGVAAAIIGLFLSPFGASCGTGVLGIVLGLLLLLPLSMASKARDKDIRELIASDSLSERLTGLRVASEKGIVVCDLAGFDNILNSRIMVERRWAAEALAAGGCPNTETMLVKLLHDPEPYVRCHAVLSLSKLGTRFANGTLLNMMITTDHWYLQTYIYSALRNLGWHQKVS